MAKFTFYFSFVIIYFVNNVINEDIIINSFIQKSEQHPARDFSRHTLIKPRIYHGREKRHISTTKEENGGHINHVTIPFSLNGEDVILDLILNQQLIPKGFFRKYQKNGKHKVDKPQAENVEHCYYNGKVRGKPTSWVALSTCHGLSGAVYDGQEFYYIENNNSTNPNLKLEEREHFVYKHSDLVEHNKTCGYSGGKIQDPSQFEEHNNRKHRYKRDTKQNELVRGPYNANKESKYVELVLVVDNREYKELGESTSRVEHHCKTIANIMNGLYAPLNIFIALVGVVIWTEHDEISFSSDGDTTLTNFLHYRREKLIKEHPNDNAQLLTKFNFDNGVVGKALKGPICTYEYSGGVNTDHSPVVGLVATTVAHEMGHNFGMEHDTNECKCPEDRCIMAPSSSTVAPTHWSSCSLNYLLLAFTHGMDYCLKNKPQALFDSPVCGNGFVEHGEQCDCGLTEHCDNTCCNASTCQLNNNASCATGECCDLNTCKPKNAGTLCRSADYECDLPEYCTGNSEYCPEDIYKMDTEICDNGRAFCYHGFCRTRTDQCKLLWGETGKTSDEQCYKMNIKGTRHGNCGYNKFNQSFFKCEDENVLCGMLHCIHLNERLEFGMESVSILSHSFINLKGSIVPCRTAIVDLGINQVDPGLAPDGAKCGVGKMCVNQKCMSVASLQKQGPVCPKDCNGNGWCNNLGHCHCKDGFAPPHCEYPGPGGSEDSGPASDPNARKEFVIVMFIIFLGIIPTIAILAFLCYYIRHNVKFGWKKTSTPTLKSPSKSRGATFSSDATKRPEDNHSLLHEDTPPPSGLQNEFFGHFKGFSLTPMKKSEPEPSRPAPLPPMVPKVQIKSPVINRSNTTISSAKMNFLNKPILRAQSFKQNLPNAFATANHVSVAPALPPPNPGSNAKPIISSPILETSTCTAKELISPLRNAPKVPNRAAPEIPNIIINENKRPLSTPTEVNIQINNIEDKKVKESTGSTLNRIASFLKSVDKKPVINTNSLPRTHHQKLKANKMLDKNALRTIEISNPIPQTDIEITITTLPVNKEENKAVVMRAQSMRGTNVTPRPTIPTFGSMRQPNGAKRPMSIPSGNRPKSPPPPRPPLTQINENTKTKTSNQKKTDQNQYDDCLNKAAPLAKLNEISPTSSDNIYAVIEESPLSPDAKSPEKPKTSSSSTDSMGLLGEIVSEIQNRNFDSIYSTSTLARKKKEANESIKSPDSSETYVNTSSIYRSPESVYSNMSNIKSSASSTSSGYILPSAVNVPVKKSTEDKTDGLTAKSGDDKPVLTTFKSDNKPFSSTFNRSQGPLASISPTLNKKIDSETKTINKNKTPPSPTNKTLPSTTKTPPSPTNKTPLTKSISRQTTPTNLRSRKPSPTRTAPTAQIVPKTNRSITNSPDLVTSCSSKPNNKPPDVLNGGPTGKKPAVAPIKPNLNGLPKAPTKLGTGKSVSFKSPQEKKSDIKSAATKISKANSDVGGSVSKSVSSGIKQAAKQNSNVASLQQKFENKSGGNNNSSSKFVVKTKA